MAETSSPTYKSSLIESLRGTMPKDSPSINAGITSWTVPTSPVMPTDTSEPQDMSELIFNPQPYEPSITAAEMNALYQNILGRAPDKEGAKFYATSTPQEVEDALLYSSERAEVSPNTSPGLMDANAADIANLYQTILGRPADEGGLSYYDDTGKSSDQIISDFVYSPEYQSNAESLGSRDANADEIAMLYQSILGRAPDAGGLSFYDDSAMSADEIAKQLLDSPEYKGRFA